MVRKKYEIVDKGTEPDDDIVSMKLTYTAEEILEDEKENPHETRMEIRARRARGRRVRGAPGHFTHFWNYLLWWHWYCGRSVGSGCTNTVIN